MADDIDIEEHDILQNPVIRNIFPDISVLKKELDFYPDDLAPVIKEEPPCEALIITQHQNDTNINQGPTTATILQNNDEKINFKISCQPNSSKMILGSKPPKQNLRKKKEKIILETKVALQDIGPYLSQSSRFCNYCKILFPNRSLFQEHLYTKHLSSVPTKYKNTEGKNSQNANNGLLSVKGANMLPCANSDNKQKKEESCLRHACFHCEKVFYTQKLLVDHLYFVLQSKNKNFVKKTGCSEVMNVSSDVGAGVNTDHLTSKTQRTSPKLQSNVNISPRCDICCILYASVGNLNRHLKMVHGKDTHIPKRNKFIRSADNQKKIKMSPDKLISQKKKLLLDDVTDEEIPLQSLKEKLNKGETKRQTAPMLFYRCPICSYYFKKEANFEVHMTKKHQYKSCPRPLKVKFEKKCLYCTKEYRTPKILNCHIFKCHKRLTDKKKCRKSNDATKESVKVGLGQNVNIQGANQFNDLPPILKSTLFMCSKCDIHFLNAKITSSHKEHIEMLINWKCLKCSRIFKSEDQIWHERQHKFTDEFTVHELSGTITSKNKVLYCCSQCTVHFDEADFLKHRGKCEKEPPSSSYCHVCDILVDLNIKKYHENCHSSLKFGREHFTLVDADIMNDCNSLVPQESPEKTKAVERRHSRANKNNEISRLLRKFNIKENDKRLSYFFCETCKCFVSVVIDHKLHLRGRCAHLPRRICKFCGIILTQSGTKSHRKQHKGKNITLQDLKFYNIHTCKMICPPIPKLAECKICHVQLMNRDLQHVCDKETLVTCEICNCKFSPEALNLHMGYHNYSIYKNGGKQYDLTLSKKVPEISVSIDIPKIFYSCKNCNVTVDCYDKVIEHCHMHILRNEKLFVKKRCEECNLTFQQPYFNDHLKFHRKNAMLNIEHLKFDTDYFFSTEWLNHIFETLSHEKVVKIIEDSLYEKEKRVKIEVIQKGLPNLTVYQCNECKYYVAPAMIYSHIKKSCAVAKIFSCYICDLKFDSGRSRESHETIHKTAIVNQNSYRILKFIKLDGFNYNDDEKNHQYVVYECRNCYSAIDRCQTEYHKCNLTKLSKCDHCGLLINDENLNDHVLKHKTIRTYKQDNIKVVLFGEKHDTILPQPRQKSSFSGIICNYTLYQCLKCNICIKIIHFVSNHNCCLIDSCKTFCNKCCLYFCTSNYKSHKLSHDSDPDFLRENMKIICFDLSKEGLANKTEDFSAEKNNRGLILSSKENEISQVKELKSINNEEEKEKKVVKFYQCNCGLNFLNESDINSHIEECGSRINVSKQRCSKCELLFTPKILFNHLLNHHGNKKYKFIFEVIEMSKMVKDN